MAVLHAAVVGITGVRMGPVSQASDWLPRPAWWGRIGRWRQVIVDDQTEVQQAEDREACHGSDINRLALDCRPDDRGGVCERHLRQFLDGGVDHLGFDPVGITRGVLDRLSCLHHICRGLTRCASALGMHRNKINLQGFGGFPRAWFSWGGHV
jgi:hypothetical protein